MSTAANLIKRMEQMQISHKLTQNYTRAEERPRCKNCKFINRPQAAMPKCHLAGSFGAFMVSQWGFCDYYQPAIKSGANK
jgi:hypothetical protein